LFLSDSHLFIDVPLQAIPVEANHHFLDAELRFVLGVIHPNLECALL
jgi:hypothetical protein